MFRCLSLRCLAFLCVFAVVDARPRTEGLSEFQLNGDNVIPFRVLTFNIWNAGRNVHDGLYKIAKHIRIVNADIVLLQEVQTNREFDLLLAKLGSPWSGITINTTYPNVGIVTKHKIDFAHVYNSLHRTAVGTTVTLSPSGQKVAVWSLHLEYQSYGPYAANNKQVTSMKQIMAGEYPHNGAGRAQNVLELLAMEQFQKAIKEANSVPVIVGGDFNCPSHLDWTEQTKHTHGDWVVRWPATFLLQSNTSLTDSFRERYPNPLTTPGITWSTVHQASGSEWDYQIPEPLDRIDFIMYKSTALSVVDSFTYAGAERYRQQPHHQDNDYPSDHFAVVSDFSLRLSQ